MRVLMTADAVGGVWTYCMTLARAMSSRGVHYALAVMGPPPSGDQCAEAARIPGLELQHRPFRLEWMQEPWADVDSAGSWMLELAARYRPAVIHLNGYSHAACDFGAPALVVAHSCVCSWWRAVHGEPAPPEWNRYRSRIRAGLDAAAVVIAPTAAMLRDLEREHGPVRSGQVIGNAWAPRGGAQATRRENVVLAAARFSDEAKNARLLRDIAPLIRWPMVAIGEAPECAGIQMTGRLTHTDVLDRMARAEIFVHPALYEPFGLSVLEAAASNCALVLADIPSLREIWSGAAVFFHPRDAASAAAAVNRVIEHDGFRRELAAKASDRASRFSAELQAGKYLAAYGALTPAQSHLTRTFAPE